MPFTIMSFALCRGGAKDPFGNQWWIATHTEDVQPEELKRRAQAAVEGRRRP